MKTYAGERTIDGVRVFVDDQLLPERAELRRYAEMGFEWGYEGDEPRQLAFALLLDHTNDLKLSTDSSEFFMKVMVANFGNEWSITSTDIESWLSDRSTFLSRL
jgi:hypothetical protein